MAKSDAGHDRPHPDTTPAGRTNRMGQPSLARPILILAVVAVIAIFFALWLGRSGEPDIQVEGEPQSGGLVTSAPPTGAGTNPDGGIDTPDSGMAGDDFLPEDTFPADPGVAPAPMGGVQQGAEDPMEGDVPEAAE